MEESKVLRNLLPIYVFLVHVVGRSKYNRKAAPDLFGRIQFSNGLKKLPLRVMLRSIKESVGKNLEYLQFYFDFQLDEKNSFIYAVPAGEKELYYEETDEVFVYEPVKLSKLFFLPVSNDIKLSKLFTILYIWYVYDIRYESGRIDAKIKENADYEKPIIEFAIAARIYQEKTGVSEVMIKQSITYARYLCSEKDAINKIAFGYDDYIDIRDGELSTPLISRPKIKEELRDGGRGKVQTLLPNVMVTDMFTKMLDQFESLNTTLVEECPLFLPMEPMTTTKEMRKIKDAWINNAFPLEEVVEEID